MITVNVSSVLRERNGHGLFHSHEGTKKVRKDSQFIVSRVKFLLLKANTAQHA
jgi:hypothetical protein